MVLDKKTHFQNLHFLFKNSTLISRENYWFFFGWKTRENVVVLDSLAVYNFNFTRKIVKKNLDEKLVKMLYILSTLIFWTKIWLFELCVLSHILKCASDWILMKKKISVEGSLITINYGQALYPVTNFSTIFQCCCKTHFPLLTLCFLEHLRLTYTSLLRNTKAHWSTQKIQFYLTHCGSIPIFVIKFDFV